MYPHRLLLSFTLVLLSIVGAAAQTTGVREVSASERNADRYSVYRLFAFREAPRLYMLAGAIPKTCLLVASSFLARPR